MEILEPQNEPRVSRIFTSIKTEMGQPWQQMCNFSVTLKKLDEDTPEEVRALTEASFYFSFPGKTEDEIQFIMEGGKEYTKRKMLGLFGRYNIAPTGNPEDLNEWHLQIYLAALTASVVWHSNEFVRKTCDDVAFRLGCRTVIERSFSTFVTSFVGMVLLGGKSQLELREAEFIEEVNRAIAWEASSLTLAA